MPSKQARQTEDSACAVGIDVGGTKIAAGIVRFPSAKVTARRTILTRPQRGGEAILADVMELARNLSAQAQRLSTSFGGIGVAVAELVDTAGNVSSEQTIAWARIPVRDRVSIIAPAVVESDVRAAALAEARFGAGRNYLLVCYVTVSTGISYTLVQHGRPYEGARGNAIILSSAPLTIECPKCHVEVSQILEEYASGPALVRRYNERSPKKATRGEEVTAAAESREPWAVQVVQSAGRALGSSVGFLINILDPGVVVVGGGLGLAGGLYWNSFVESARRHVWSDTTRKLPIVPAALGADSGIVGAATAAWDRVSQADKARNGTRAMVQRE
jgi:glucokinase